MQRKYNLARLSVMSQNLSNTMESRFICSVLDVKDPSYQINITSFYFELILGSFYNKNERKRKLA